MTNVTNPGDDPASDAVWHLNRAGGRKVGLKMVALLRDIFGNPFRKVERDPPWVAPVRAILGDGVYRDKGLFNPAWLSSTVVAIAAQMYESRDFSAMPILADSLQDAGCDNEDVLHHCRGNIPHVRGCWVVDLILGKS